MMMMMMMMMMMNKHKLKDYLIALWEVFIVGVMFAIIILIMTVMLFPDNVKADGYSVNMYLEHISDPTFTEIGRGLNAFWTTIKYNRDNMFLEAGLGVHANKYDCPEFCVGSGLLAKIRIGVSFDLK